ncbi:MAG: hypothetical protein DRP83_08255, partial [Planctomycetota bacterium]
MYVSIINAETSNHMIHEKEAAKCEGIFGTANSAVILTLTKLALVTRRARKDPKFQFTSLAHLLNAEFLRGCYESIG